MGRLKITSSGRTECKHCGKQLHEHDKERITEGNGRYSYNYVCPN